MRVASDLEEVVAWAGDASAPVVLIFDADNTLVAQGVELSEFQQGVNAAIARFDALPSVERVIVITNGPDRGVPGMISRGNKPWTTRKRLDLDSTSADVWVVGDQVLTDGVLAWRLGAAYVQLVVNEETEATRQVVMRRIGRVVTGLLFVPEPAKANPRG
jgi:predicted HAD superfamily phosphohydrolase YqeG